MIDVALIEKYARPAPRYTSYPTALQFHEGVDARTYRGWLEALSAGTTASLYVHIPFCDSLCWFCGCQTKQILRYEPIRPYLDAVTREIGTLADRIGDKVDITNIHWGGGSPTILSPDDIRRLAGTIDERFALAPDVDFSVEVDPRGFDAERAAALAESGMTRASIGVQDFSPKVQAAINRVQSFETTKAAADLLRAHGVASLNVDLVYGLPHQTRDNLAASLDKVLELAPDRIALFGYAHVPWMKPHQRLIPGEALPGAVERYAQMELAGAKLVCAGYRAIGIDHFALPGDLLALAAEAGTLHRNFQGYTTDRAEALIGLGASSIGRLPQGYVQNEKATGRYIAAAGTGELPVVRGVALTADDRLRGHVIERLLCDFRLSMSTLQARFGTAATPVSREARILAAADADGLVAFDGGDFVITAKGRPFARAIAAGFDSHIAAGERRHSIAV